MSLTLCSTLLQYINPNIFKYFSSKVLGNHYDVLNLSRTCSAKEIKESFIKLSKESHPDVNKSKDAHKRFLEINKAYEVLSKTESRRLYDLGLGPPEGVSYRNEIRVPYKEQFGSDPWKDPSFYINRNKADDKKYENEPYYYGIKGLKRVSNLTVVIFCLTVTTIVVSLQVLAIRHSLTFKRDELIKRSNSAQDSLKQVREAAALNGNEKQLEILKQKFADNLKYKDKTYFSISL
ncbi:dnaJ-like protein 60 [Anoplophora glabripennis]|nr:dnaJ-like protein 60 [Anoplophora glabripennis]